MISKVNNVFIPGINPIWSGHIMGFTDISGSGLITFDKEFCIYVHEEY